MSGVVRNINDIEMMQRVSIRLVKIGKILKIVRIQFFFNSAAPELWINS